MTHLIIILLTTLSIFLIIYHHAGYPLLLRLLSRRNRNISQPETEQPTQQSLPTITIVVPAYNEEKFIADKIRNLSIIDYPKSKLNIIIASDGSTDNTYQVALNTLNEAECRNFPIKIIDFDKNRGKVAVLNSVLSTIKTDILALSDVSALISIDALMIAVRHFNNPEVGVVNGTYKILNPGSEGEKKYWDYQSRVKSDEASIGSVIGSHGAFYLLRTHLYKTLPDDTINDDFIIPMQIVKHGYRSIFEPNIHAIELEHSDDALDSSRRNRISAGNLQQALRLKTLLLPRYRGTAFTFASGKVLRVFMPYLMIIAFSGSLYLSSSSTLFLLCAIGQTLVYGLFLFSEFLGLQHYSKILQTLAYLVKGHAAGLTGSLHYLKSIMVQKIRLSLGNF